jgi:sulfur-oxidizing protein SoxZ
MAAGPMRIRAASNGSETEVKILMSHDMETGQRKDASGNLIPAHHITEITATHNGRVVLAGQFGPAVAKNPYLQFKFKGGAKGDKVSVSWVDNKGEKRTDEVVVS